MAEHAAERPAPDAIHLPVALGVVVCLWGIRGHEWLLPCALLCLAAGLCRAAVRVRADGWQILLAFTPALFLPAAVAMVVPSTPGLVVALAAPVLAVTLFCAWTGAVWSVVTLLAFAGAMARGQSHLVEAGDVVSAELALVNLALVATLLPRVLP